jgi:hypothetical protein
MSGETELTKQSAFSKIVFIFVLLITIHFWDLKFVPQKYNIENIFAWIVCGYCFLFLETNTKMLFRNAIFLFLIGLMINVFASYIHLNQSPFNSILSFSWYYFILFYFMLHYFKFNREYLEKIIIIFGAIYSGLYVMQYLIYPNTFFKHDPLTAQGGKQFEILGHGFLMLAYFLVLNRYLLKRRLNDILMALGFLVVLLLCDFRTLILGAILVSAFMVFRLVKFSVRDILIVIFVILLIGGMTQVKFVSDIIKSSVTDTQKNFKEGEKYVRLVQFEFFFKRYPQDFSYFIIGGGKASGDNIWKFNRYAIGQNYNIVWVDIGLLGFYIVIGAFAVGGLLWYTLKAIFMKLPRDRLYLSLYFLYLLIVSFTNEEIYRNGIFTVHAIALYLIDIAMSEKSAENEDIKVSEAST